MNRSVLMTALLSLALALPGFGQSAAAARNVLIITDTLPPARALAAGLKAAEDITSEIVSADGLPSSLSSYRAVIVAMSGAVPGTASTAIQNYTDAGGRLILLHRSIGPHQPAEWLDFVGVKFTTGDAARGGLRGITSAPVELVALSHRSPVIETKVAFDKAVVYRSTSRPRDMRLPGMSFPPTEVFLNHSYTRLKQSLMGIKVTDVRSGVTYMQDTGIWVDELEKGVIFYFMIGQKVSDFQVKAYVQMVANAVVIP